MRGWLTRRRAAAGRLGRGRRLLVAVGVCALGGGAVAVAQTQVSTQTQLSSDLPVLPLPPLFEYEGDVGEGPVEGEPPVDPDDSKGLMGFGGPLYNPGVQTGGVEVLPQTIRQADDARWHVLGLARNQSADTVHTVTVTARLRSAAGATLDTLSATSPVRGARKGEPVPFELASPVAASSVAEVQYSAAGVAGDAVDRQFAIRTHWERPYTEPSDDGYVHRHRPGDRGGRRTEYPHVDPQSGPRPYVKFGQVENLGPAPASPTVVGAWLVSNRVLDIEVLRRITSDGPFGTVILSDTAPVDPGGSSDFVYANNDPDLAPLLSDAEFVTWAGSETP